MLASSSPAARRGHDFDFLEGSWLVHHRRLKERLAGCDEWEEFESTADAVRFFDGAGSFDVIGLEHLGWSGASLRLFDPVTEEWTIYWANSSTGRLEPPVTGRFVDGRGEFSGDDTHEGMPVRVRYVWSEITPSSARWEQAFSVDDGETWETNWIMELARQT